MGLKGGGSVLFKPYFIIIFKRERYKQKLKLMVGTWAKTEINGWHYRNQITMDLR